MTDKAFHAFAALSAVLFATAIALIWRAPVELQMGIVQKIFYFHVPAANGMYIGFITAAVGSLMYLWKRTERWEAISLAGAEIGLLFTLIVLLTGPLWGRKAWGAYWVWDPRLTSTLLTGTIYLAFLALRSGQAGEVEKRFAAALAVVGFPMLFLIKFSVQRWSGQHPVVMARGGGGIAPEMVPAFATSMVAFAVLVTWLLWLRTRLELQRIRVLDLELAAIEEGKIEE